ALCATFARPIMKHLLPFSFALLVALAAGAQEQQFEGSWKIDRAKNESTVRAAGPGRAGGPPANQLGIKVSAGEVTIDSDTGSDRRQLRVATARPADRHDRTSVEWIPTARTRD